MTNSFQGEYTDPLGICDYSLQTGTWTVGQVKTSKHNPDCSKEWPGSMHSTVRQEYIVLRSINGESSLLIFQAAHPLLDGATDWAVTSLKTGLRDMGLFFSWVLWFNSCGLEQLR